MTVELFTVLWYNFAKKPSDKSGFVEVPYAISNSSCNDNGVCYPWSYLFKRKRCFLIAGYNTTSKAEKQKTDEKKLCSFMGKMMFILAGCWLVIASSEIFKAMWLLWVGLCLFFVVCVGAVIYMNSGNRFKR